MTLNETLAILKSPLLAEVEQEYANRVSLPINPQWVDSVETSKGLTFAGMTDLVILQTLSTNKEFIIEFAADIVAKVEEEEQFSGTLLDEDEEEDDPMPEDEDEQLPRGCLLFFTVYFCLLETGKKNELIKLLKFRKIPDYKEFGTLVEAVYVKLKAAKDKK